MVPVKFTGSIRALVMEPVQFTGSIMAPVMELVKSTGSIMFRVKTGTPVRGCVNSANVVANTK